jgi:hypothetical protein
VPYPDLLGRNRWPAVPGVQDPARAIHKHFHMVQDLAKLLHGHRRSTILLKIDIAKSFDTVN